LLIHYDRNVSASTAPCKGGGSATVKVVVVVTVENAGQGEWQAEGRRVLGRSKYYR